MVQDTAVLTIVDR